MTTSPAASADRTRRRWWSEAAATGGTSALLDCPDGSDAGLDLTTAHPSGLAQLLAGGPAPLSSLVREAGAFAEARRRARAVHRLAAALLAQRGLRSLAVAVGTAGWSPVAGEAVPGAPRRTPVLLRRCTLTPTGEALDDFVVRLAPDVIVNPVLVRVAREELGIALDAGRIGAAVGGHRGFDPAPALEEVRRQLAGTPGLRVHRRLLLATFADPGADLLADLRRRGASVRGHRVVSALAAGTPVEPLERPGRQEGPLESGFALDPTQRAALEHVARGEDLRLEAPTGTGATQVAAALVADAIARERSVLLVADSAADRRAVDERLRDNGFGRLVLHLVGDLDAAAVAADARAQLEAARAELEARRSAPPRGGARPDLSGPAGVLEEHARALHTRRSPWDVSAHDAMDALATLGERTTSPSTTRRLRGEALAACSREDVTGWSAKLREAVALGAFDVSPSTTAWAGAQLRTREAATEALARVRRVVEEELPRARAQLATCCDSAGLRGASSVGEAHERVTLMLGVRETLGRFGAEVYAHSLGDVAAGTATAQWRRERGVRLGVLGRWRLRRQARALVRPGVTATGTDELHDWLQQARAQRLTWQRVTVRDGAPAVPEGLDALHAAVTDLRADLLALQEVLPASAHADLGGDGSLLGVQLPELASLLKALAADATALDTLPRRTVLLDELRAAGWGPLLDDLGARWEGPGSIDLTAEVEAAWWSGVLDAFAMADPLVGAPDAGALRSARTELQLAEAAARAHTAHGVRDAVDQRVLGAGGGSPQGRAADAVLLPCTALSGAAAAALAQQLPDVDLVVVLGAQAAAVATVLPALSRGRGLVVVGDPGLPGPQDLPTARDVQAPQLPADAAPAPARPGLLAESAGVLPTLRLGRQHACLDDRLVEGFPGAAQDSLPGTGLDARAVRRTSSRPVGARRGPDALVDLVVETALEALREHPEESLGIVVADAPGAELLADALRRRALAERLPLTVGREPLLVADPARWSGERRDHVLVVADAVLNGPGLGAQPEPSAALAEVRLAVTRPRLRSTLVLDDSGWDSGPGSVPGAAADPAATADTTAEVAAGRRLLLQTAVRWEAARGRAGEGRAGGALDGRSALVRRLAAACAARGLPSSCEVGGSRAIALVVRDARVRVGAGPALAVELDDPQWAAGDVVDREVAGPARLERRGWRYVRALEADVFADPAGEAGRLVGLWRDVLAEAGHDPDHHFDHHAELDVDHSADHLADHPVEHDGRPQGVGSSAPGASALGDVTVLPRSVIDLTDGSGSDTDAGQHRAENAS